MQISNYLILLFGGVMLLLLMLIVVLLLKLVKSDQKKAKIQRKYNYLEGKINSLQLETLEARLNPHLFKNILNSIQSHAYQTYFALDKLANVLDYILYESKNKFVTAKEEVDFALNLIEINKIKISPLFDLKIKTKINGLEPLYEQRLLAPLISIDLIENAFKHADLQSPDAFIAITFEFKDSVFTITAANKVSSAAPLKKQKGGVGAETLEQRLKIIYKDNYKLEKFVEKDVYIAHLKINLHAHKAQMLAAR